MGTTQIAPRNFAVPLHMQPEWFAVQTSARHEKRVAEHLQGRGVPHFLPLYEESHRWADRVMRVQLPLFPGYLFVRIAVCERMCVLQVPGVSRLVGFGGSAAPLQQCEIEALQRGIASGIGLEPHPYLKAGIRARVRCGPLRGLEGVVVRIKDSLRVVISVDLIVRSVAVDIDSADLQILS